MSRRRWKNGVLGLPAVGLSLVPKFVCPVCSPAYAALLSSLGVSFLASTRYLFPLTTVLLSVAVASMFIGAATRRGRAPFWTGVAAAVLILFGKFSLDSAVVMYSGVGSLVIASAWNAFPRRTTGPVCGACLPTDVRAQQGEGR
jgi:hypothetical protein